VSEPGLLPLVSSRALPAGCSFRETGGPHSLTAGTHRSNNLWAERNCRTCDEGLFPDLAVIVPTLRRSLLPGRRCRGTKMQAHCVYM
jgi:hypothetical protein